MKRVDQKLYLALGLKDVWYDIHPWDSSPVKSGSEDLLRLHVKFALKVPEVLSPDRRGRLSGPSRGIPFFIHTDLKLDEDHK